MRSYIGYWGRHSVDGTCFPMQALAPGSKANLASTLTTPPPPMTHNAAPAPVRITVSDSPYVCKESKSAAVHGVSSNSSSSKVSFPVVAKLLHHMHSVNHDALQQVLWWLDSCLNNN